MNKTVKVTIEADISTNGFDSEEQLKEYFKENLSELLEVIDSCDKATICINGEKIDEN